MLRKSIVPTPVRPEPFSSPSTSSANPAASLPALWGYIKPTLDHILITPIDNIFKPPAIDVGYHMGIHTAVYNYFTGSQSPKSDLTPSSSLMSMLASTSPSTPSHDSLASRQHSGMISSRTDLYQHIDGYFTEIGREYLLSAPQGDIALVQYLIPCFHRYSSGAQAISRLLDYVNRHYVRGAIDEDEGWLCLSDIIDELIHPSNETDSHDTISMKLQQRRALELEKWGYREGDPPGDLAVAEASAEAASGLERIVPLMSLAHRRFRTEVLEPMLTVIKVKGKIKAKKKGKRHLPAHGSQSRLTHAMQTLLESQDIEEQEKRRLAGEMAKMMKTVGTRTDHPLCRRLSKFAALSST